MMDKRRRPFVAIDLLFPFKKTCERLETKFGHAGPLAFLYLIMAAKRAPDQGQVVFTGEADFWHQLGFHTPPDFTMDEFLTFLGRLKQTSRTPLGRAQNVRITHFEDWQKLPESEMARRRMARKRAQNTRNDDGTMSEPSPKLIGTERRGEETTFLESPTTGREGDSLEVESPPQQAAATRPNGRKPTDQVPAYPTAEHHKHYRPDKAEQYARNIGPALTPSLLEQDLRAEFAGIPEDEAHRLATEYGAVV